MATLTGPNLGLKYNWDIGTFYKTEMDANLKLMDMLNQLAVIDKDISAQPVSPTEGDRYIVGPTATGTDWAGEENNIAVFVAAVWEFHVPKAGWAALAIDEGFMYRHNGTSWVLLAAPASISESITDLATTGATPMDLSLGRNFRTPGATGNVTLSFTNIPASLKTEVAYTWVQDATGTRTLAFPAGTIWHNGIAPTPTATTIRRLITSR